MRKFEDMTPEAFRCHTSNCCPAVLKTEDGKILIIGKKLSADEQNALSHRIADDEFVIEVDRDMLTNV